MMCDWPTKANSVAAMASQVFPNHRQKHASPNPTVKNECGPQSGPNLGNLREALSHTARGSQNREPGPACIAWLEYPVSLSLR